MNGAELASGASALLMGVVQMAKSLIPDSWHDKLLPLITLVFGVVYTTFLSPVEGSLGSQVLAGLNLGFVSIGLFVTAKKAGGTVTGLVKKKKK